MKRKNIIFLLIIVTISIAAFFVYGAFAYEIDYSSCIKCDGKEYLHLYHYFLGKESFSTIRFPFYQRVLVPWLASIIPFDDPVACFRSINLFFTVVAVASLFYLWKKLSLPNYLIGIAFFWFLFHRLGIIREYESDPITVDLPVFFLQTVLMVIIWHRQWKWLWLLGPVATLQKESFLPLLLVLFILFVSYHYIVGKEESYERERRDIFLAFIISLMVKITVDQLLPAVDDKRNSFYTLGINSILFLMEPLKLIRWVVALCMGYGCFLFLALLNVKKNFKFDFFQLTLLGFSFTYFFFGLIAGGDTTRILMLGFPFIMTYCLLVIKNENRWLIGLSFLLYIPVMRLISNGRYPILWRHDKPAPEHYYWFINYAELDVVTPWAIYFLFCYIIIFYLSSWFNQKEKI